MKPIIISLLALALFACHHQRAEYPVHSYRQQDSSGDWIWWYIMYTNASSNSCPCYSYSNPTQVNNFQSVNFEKSESIPPAFDLQTAKTEAVVEVPVEQIAPEVAEEWSENFDVNDTQEQGGAQEGFDESSQSSESGSESSDGGSGGFDGGGSGGGGE